MEEPAQFPTTSFEPSVGPTSVRGVAAAAWRGFVQGWVLGQEPTGNADTPLRRWLLRPARKSVSLFLLATAAIYAALCLWDGWSWATQLSPTYGFIIIRISVVIMLAAIDAVMLPFRIGIFLGLNLINCLILFLPLGLLHGLSLSPAGEARARATRQSAQAIFPAVGLAVLIFNYGVAVVPGDQYVGWIHEYILMSPERGAIFVLAVLAWMGRNVLMNAAARRPLPAPAMAHATATELTPLATDEFIGEAQPLDFGGARSKECPRCGTRNYETAMLCRQCAKNIERVKPS